MTLEARTQRGARSWCRIMVVLIAAVAMIGPAHAEETFRGRKVRTINIDPTPTPTPDPAANGGNGAGTGSGSEQTIAPPAPTPTPRPSNAERLGFSTGRTVGYLAGASAGALAAAWPLASKLGLKAGGRFAVGALGASVGVMTASFLMDTVLGKPEFQVMGPASFRTTGYIAGAIGGGALVGYPVLNMLTRGLSTAAKGSRLMMASRFGAVALGVAGGLAAANWLMNWRTQAVTDSQIREHDRRWNDQDRGMSKEWEASGGYLEDGGPQPVAPAQAPGGAAQPQRAPMLPGHVPQTRALAEDPLNAGEELAVTDR